MVSRSGSLSHEACFRLTSAGIGKSTVIGIGGDPEKGLNAAKAMARLHSDPDTDAILYLGEIGGNDKYAVTRYAAGGGQSDCGIDHWQGRATRQENGPCGGNGGFTRRFVGGESRGTACGGRACGAHLAAPTEAARAALAAGIRAPANPQD